MIQCLVSVLSQSSVCPLVQVAKRVAHAPVASTYPWLVLGTRIALRSYEARVLR